MISFRALAAITALSILVWGAGLKADEKEEIVVGSKNFTESVLLGDVLTQMARTTGRDVRHWRSLGGTQVIWKALLKGDIDAYVDYTGSLTAEILKMPLGSTLDDLKVELAKYDAVTPGSLGFENAYAIGLNQGVEGLDSLETVTDLKERPDIVFGFSDAFMNRRDGWPGLKRLYGLSQNPRGMDHDLAYQGVAQGQLDGTDVYTTDAEIALYNLKVLADDKGFFPDYTAIIVYRKDLQARAPEIVEAFNRLTGLISETDMQRMNGRAKIDKIPAPQVAGDYLYDVLGLETEQDDTSILSRLIRNTKEHLTLVAISLIAALIVAVPLGVVAYKVPRISPYVMATVSLFQTIPSLALFVFLIPLIGIGAWPAMIALFIYSLLPVVRNTFTGLETIPGDLKESALALGLPPMARLRLIELPLALPTILAGVKTAAVINVGTATLGALIGAGGYGEPILTGIRLDDTQLILLGAIPAALLSLLVLGLFRLLESALTPAGLNAD